MSEIEELKRDASQGDVEAQCLLGCHYSYGQNPEVPMDKTMAAYWLKKAAEKGFAHAQFQLGLLYLNGQGVGKDLERCLKLMHSAAEQGHGSAIQFMRDLD